MLTKTQYQNNLNWIEALRSGKFKQTTGQLHNLNHEMCCIGVACDLIYPDRWLKKKHSTDEGYVCKGEFGEAPKSIYNTAYGWGDSYGFSIPWNDSNASLVDLNDDHRLSFEEIAVVAEEWLNEQEVKKC